MRIAILSSALLCLGLSFPQEPNDPTTPQPMPGSKAAMKTLMSEMQGVWKLKEFESPTLERVNRLQTGYLLLSGSYFSFEMHMSWPSPDTRIVTLTSTTGTHKFEMDEIGRMTARVVIGTDIDNMGVVHWAEPGRVRKFDITCVSDVLKMKREDGAEFVFDRMVDTKTPRDIYGRPLKLKDPNDPKAPPKEPTPKEPKKN
jgi:hypothetical protein